MSVTVIPRGPKPKEPIPLHQYMYRAIPDIEHNTATALTCRGAWGDEVEKFSSARCGAERKMISMSGERPGAVMNAPSAASRHRKGGPRRAYDSERIHGPAFQINCGGCRPTWFGYEEW